MKLDLEVLHHGCMPQSSGTGCISFQTCLARRELQTVEAALVRKTDYALTQKANSQTPSALQ
jgi:hypothetical protein